MSIGTAGGKISDRFPCFILIVCVLLSTSGINWMCDLISERTIENIVYTRNEIFVHSGVSHLRYSKKQKKSVRS